MVGDLGQTALPIVAVLSGVGHLPTTFVVVFGHLDELAEGVAEMVGATAVGIIAAALRAIETNLL